MSDPTMTPPAGWYADPDGSSALRWWDGTAWTDYRSSGAATERRALPADVSPETPWIYLVVLLPLLSFATLFTVDFRGMMFRSLEQPGNPFAMFGVGYFVGIAFSWILAGLVVWFSYLDWKALKEKGVDRPFHWAWAFFLGYPVYLIGRSVIVHRVSKRGLRPIWTYVGVVVFTVIVTVVFAVWIFQSMFEYTSQYYGNYS